MTCSDENELIEFADGILIEPRRTAVAQHVDTCTDCRATLAEIARAVEIPAPFATAPAPKVAARRGELPRDVLHQYLRLDAPRRELGISRFVALFILVALPLSIIGALASRLSWLSPAIAAALFAYEATVVVLLQRGWFRPWLPFVSSIVEVSFVCAMQLMAMRVSIGFSSDTFPGAILLGALIVFSAFRSNPRLCLVVGVVAAIEVLALGLFGVAHAAVAGHDFSFRSFSFRALLCLGAGVVGRALAKNMVDRAEAALRDIREQDMFGKYLLHEQIGEGGMGEVFRATYCPEGGFVRAVAIKRVRTDLSADARFAAAFRREVQLGASLVHPNLVQLLDCGRFRGAFVVAAELVDGASLATILRARKDPLPLAAVTYLGAELCAALHYVHTKRDADGEPLRLVHCDVNPPNILVSRIGEVKLTDFGVARVGASSDERGGKAAYAAPEQLRGEDVDGRADLFALGLTLYEAITGGRAITGAKSSALNVTPGAPSLARPEISSALDALIVDLISASPAKRPRDANEARARLLALEGAEAPYPAGAGALAEAVLAALAPSVDRAPAGEKTATTAITRATPRGAPR